MSESFKILQSVHRMFSGTSGTLSALSQVPGNYFSTYSPPPAALQLCEMQPRPKLADMTHNGEKVQGLFTENEMTRRLNNLRLYMCKANVDACVFTSYHNINYFGGFMYCSFGRNYGLVVTMDRAVTISAGIDGGQPWRRCVGDNVTYTDWHRDNFFHAVKTELQEINGKIGLEFDHVSVDNMNKFNNWLPNPKVDIGTPTMYMRLIKSEEEQNVIREGARIADIGGAAVTDAIKEGVAEYEIAMKGTQAMIKEIALAFPQTDIMDTWVWFQSGINTDGAHNPVTTRKLQKGDILSLNCFPMIGGYYTALERTLFLDHASNEAIKLWNINCQVHRRGLELIKPGVRCCDIAVELNDMYAQHGLLEYRSFGYGHSFGALSHYYGREAALEIREDIDTVLQPGMVVSMEPMITIPQGKVGAGGYREHDILIITKDGAENITKFPFGSEHLIIKENI